MPSSQVHVESHKECPPRSVDGMNLDEQDIHCLHPSTISVTRFHVLDGNWDTPSETNSS